MGLEMKWVLPIICSGFISEGTMKKSECRPCNLIAFIRAVFEECAISKPIFINEIVLAGVVWDTVEHTKFCVVLQLSCFTMDIEIILF